jgi:hypothetical protein
MKRSVLFVFALFIGAALSAQNAADFQYTVENGAVTITGYTGSAKNVTIPGQIDGLPVTIIGNGAFREKQLTSVTIPNSVISIGQGAFAQNRLTSVTIPNSVTTIGDSAFVVNQLTSVIIPGSVTTIDREVFAQNQLTSITIPNSVAIIGEVAFAQNQLTSVTIPNSVATIGKGAFWQTPLTSVTIGANANVTADPFPGNFADVYTSGGKRAGTYRSYFGGKAWARQQ